MNKFFGPMLIILVTFLDQFTKWHVTERIFRYELGMGDPLRFSDWLHNAPQRMTDVTIKVCSLFNLSMVWNEGISFGFLHSGGWGLLTIISLVISLFFFIWMLRANALFEIVALAAIVGGALGNVFDRIRFGAVVDFLDFHWNDTHFPAFNLADAAITTGVALLVVHSLFFARKGE